jgi:hypothetical protein
LVQCSRHFLCHTLDVCWKVCSTDFTTAWWRTFWMRKAKIYLCLNYLTFPHNSCIKNKMRVREAEGIFKIEVHKCTWQRKENCDRKSTGTWPTLPPLFFAIFFHTLLNIILVSNNLKSTIFFLYIDLFTNFAIELFLRFSILLYRWYKKWTWKFKFS